MRICIDDSGSFAVPPLGKRNYCCLGAAVIPDAKYNLLSHKFNSLKARWQGGTTKEMKGSSLSETQVAQVIKLCDELGVKFFTCGTDMSDYTSNELEAARETLANKIVGGLTPEHQPTLVAQLEARRDQMKELSFPLFVQFVLLNELVARVLRAALLHFSLVAPRELGDLSWILDAKDKTLTEYEVMWTMLSGPLLQSALLREPSFGVQGGDSSEFDREFMFHTQTWPDHLPKPHMEPGGTNSRIMDLRKILSKSRTFADSKDIVGLQIADILTNAFRRAVRGSLQSPGWSGLGKLMLRAGNESVAGWMTLTAEKDGQLLPPERAKVFEVIESQARLAFEQAMRGVGFEKK